MATIGPGEASLGKNEGIANPHDNKYFSIELQHLPTKERVLFNGWVTQFADSFVSEWNNTPVYGRMDNLYTFKRTGRKLSIAFDVVALDNDEAQLNQRNLNRLTQFLYPVYSSSGPASSGGGNQIITAAPLLRMSYTGLVADAEDGGGLVGFLQGFTYTPNLEGGPMIVKSKQYGYPVLIYQTYTVQLEFTVLHTHMTGWVTRSNPDGSTSYVFAGDDVVEKHFPHAGAADDRISAFQPVSLVPPGLASALELEGRIQVDELRARQAELLGGAGGGGEHTPRGVGETREGEDDPALLNSGPRRGN